MRHMDMNSKPQAPWSSQPIPLYCVLPATHKQALFAASFVFFLTKTSLPVSCPCPGLPEKPSSQTPAARKPAMASCPPPSPPCLPAGLSCALLPPSASEKSSSFPLPHLSLRSAWSPSLFFSVSQYMFPLYHAFLIGIESPPKNSHNSGLVCLNEHRVPSLSRAPGLPLRAAEMETRGQPWSLCPLLLLALQQTRWAARGSSRVGREVRG